MKKLRKIVAIAMTAALACSVLAGCGGAVEGGNTASVKSWLYIPQSDMDKRPPVPRENETWNVFMEKYRDLRDKYMEMDDNLQDESLSEEEYREKLAELNIQYQEELAKLEQERDAELEKLEQASEEDMDKSMTYEGYLWESDRIWQEYYEKEDELMVLKSEKEEEVARLYFDEKISTEEYQKRLNGIEKWYQRELQRLVNKRDAALEGLENRFYALEDMEKSMMDWEYYAENNRIENDYRDGLEKIKKAALDRKCKLIKLAQSGRIRLEEYKKRDKENEELQMREKEELEKKRDAALAKLEERQKASEEDMDKSMTYEQLPNPRYRIFRDYSNRLNKLRSSKNEKYNELLSLYEKDQISTEEFQKKSKEIDDWYQQEVKKLNKDRDAVLDRLK